MWLIRSSSCQSKSFPPRYTDPRTGNRDNPHRLFSYSRKQFISTTHHYDVTTSTEPQHLPVPQLLTLKHPCILWVSSAYLYLMSTNPCTLFHNQYWPSAYPCTLFHWPPIYTLFPEMSRLQSCLQQSTFCISLILLPLRIRVRSFWQTNSLSIITANDWINQLVSYQHVIG